MKKLALLLGLAACLGAGVFWVVTIPRTADPAVLAGLQGDAQRGRAVFTAAGCGSCHAAKDAKDDARLMLGGGQEFPSPFGTFVAPNISSDPTHGIGGWSELDLLNALHHGTSPDGRHYFPAFPYGTYTRMTAPDAVDLRAYLATLPAVAIPSAPHRVPFPFNIRRTLGGWKLLFLDDGWMLDDAPTPQLQRGRYLVEALGHCGECHTERNLLGGLKPGRWLAGAPNPAGKGRIPNITPGKLDWSEADIVEYLTSGFTPEFDTAGGEMVEVIENTAAMSNADRAAIAAYLKAIPAVE